MGWVSGGGFKLGCEVGFECFGVCVLFCCVGLGYDEMNWCGGIDGVGDGIWIFGCGVGVGWFCVVVLVFCWV